MASFLTGLVNVAFNALPAGTKAAVTFTRLTQGLDVVTNLVTTTKSTASATAAAVANDLRRFNELSLVLITPVTLLVAADALGTFIPRAGDTFVWGGKTYTVRDVVTLNPDGTTSLLHTVVGSL